jgi:hypothetical protein
LRVRSFALDQLKPKAVRCAEHHGPDLQFWEVELFDDLVQPEGLLIPAPL